MTTEALVTHAQFIDAVKELVAQRSKRGARTKDEARKQLIDEGIVTQSGNLTPEYGGPEQPKLRRAGRIA